MRVRSLNDAAIRTPARNVLHWPQMNLCVEWNHALAHAAPLANELHFTLLHWGKKIIEWSPTYQDTFDNMVEIHDRPWPKRPAFGTIHRYVFRRHETQNQG